MSEKPRMLWVARDTDGRIDVFGARPSRADADGDVMWDNNGNDFSELVNYEFAQHISPGECRMFVEYAPRVAETGGPHSCLRWSNNGGWQRAPYAMPGDIILPMPPDPTPYLTPADPNAARREEIRAQIAALQEELEGMEGGA